MTFEDDLRTTLQSQADDLDLHGRGPAETMRLARRRQHRARRAGAVAAVGVLGVGAAGVLAARRTDGVAVTVADQVGLPDVGPLELSWQTTPSGITGGPIGEPRFTDDGGALYALSTAPGARYPQDGGPLAAALYRLADDGTWVVAGTGDGAPMVDVAAEGSTLYAIGTAPNANPLAYDAVLSSSSDGGATWTAGPVAPVTPPNGAVAWVAGSTVAIERIPGATIAVVTSRFSPPDSLIEGAAAAAGASGVEVTYEIGDAGIEVVGIPPDPSDAVMTPSPSATVAPTSIVTSDGAVGTVPPLPAGASPATSSAPDGSAVAAVPPGKDKPEPTRQPITTISWSEVGLTGRSDLMSTQVLVGRDGAWTQVDSPALEGISIDRLAAAGNEVVLEGWDRSGAARVLWSSDGATWLPVAVGDDSRVGGLGNAWIDVPWSGDGRSPVVRSSFDRGASWATVDLGAVDGRLTSTIVASFDSGPLGFAAVAVDHGDGPESATSYLVTTRDLRSWTVTPLADVTGPVGAEPAVHVGADRVVITASAPYTGDDSVLPASVTAVGTPVR